MYPVCPAASDWMFPPAQTLVTAVTKHKDRKIFRIRRILYLPSCHNNLSSSPRFPTSSIKTGIRTLLNHSETLRIDSLPILEQTKPLKRYLYFPPWTSSVMSRLARTALAFVLWFIDVNPGIDKRVFYGACCTKSRDLVSRSNRSA